MKTRFHLIRLVALICVSSPGMAHALDIAKLLVKYKEFGLALPDDSAQLTLITRSHSTVNGVPQYDRQLAFVSKPSAGNATYWLGARTLTLGRVVSSEQVEGTTVDLQKTQTSSQCGQYGKPRRFATFPDLALAIHCQARGFEELADAFLERSQTSHKDSPFEYWTKRPRDDTEALALLAFHHWSDEFAYRGGDRSQVVERLQSLIEGPYGLATEAHRNMIADMRLTLAPRAEASNGVEALLDSLLDASVGDDAYGVGICDSEAGQRTYKKLQRMGLDAVPVLIEHARDFRVTRVISESKRGHWHLRIADVVHQLLDDVSSEELAYDFLIAQGRGRAVDRQHAMYWWAQTQGGKARDYLVEHAVVAQRSDQMTVNASIVAALADQFDLEFSPDASWKEAEWRELRQQVNQALEQWKSEQ